MVPTDSDQVEMECPVCDRTIPSNAKSCPGCGADFQSSGIEDLEAVVNDLSRPEQPERKESVEVIVQKEDKPPEEVNQDDLADEKKGLLKRWFGKK